MKKAKEILREKLELADPGLIGCIRRNLWAQEGPEPWRRLRGNALMAVLGEKHAVETPVGTLEFFMLHKRWLLQFRGGQWNSYWTEDFFDLWSIIETCGRFDSLSPSVVVLHENKGQLSVQQVSVPENLEPAPRARALFEGHETDPPARISKAGARAMRVCRYCPTKGRCDAQDQLRHDTDDWSTSYREDLA